jgi:integrase
MSKRARNHAGTVERRGALWWVQVSMPAGHAPRRPRVPIHESEKMTEAQARKAGAKLARDARDGKLVLEPKAQARGGVAVNTNTMTVRQLGEAWTSGELYKKHGPVNKLAPMAGGYIMGTQLNKRAYKIKTRGLSGSDFGELPVSQVQHTDIARIMAEQTGAAGTRNHIHNYLARIFALAEIPLGLRPVGTNPVLSAYRAPADEDKHFNFLYPPEVFALLSNKEIPIGRRVLYLLANYFGWRKGTLYAFKWGGIDWQDGTVSVMKQKGARRLDAGDVDEEQGTPIFFVATRDVLAVLRAWYEHCGKPAADTAVLRDMWTSGQRERHDEAKVIRDDLQASGVKREILFSKAHNVQAIRFHDGRATFCTWARRADKEDAWTKQRTGHTATSKMLDRYTRMAVTLADLNYQPFPDVTRAIPELAQAAQLHTKLHTEAAPPNRHEASKSSQMAGIIGCEGGDLNPDALSGASTSS